MFIAKTIKRVSKFDSLQKGFIPVRHFYEIQGMHLINMVC